MQSNMGCPWIFRSLLFPTRGYLEIWFGKMPCHACVHWHTFAGFPFKVAQYEFSCCWQWICSEVCGCPAFIEGRTSGPSFLHKRTLYHGVLLSRHEPHFSYECLSFCVEVRWNSWTPKALCRLKYHALAANSWFITFHCGETLVFSLCLCLVRFCRIRVLRVVACSGIGSTNAMDS